MTTTLLGVLFLGIALTLWFLVRDRLDPAFVYTGAWGGCLLGIGFAEPYGYFQISDSAATIFLIAAGSFLLGCAVVPRGRPTWQTSEVLNIDFAKLARVCLILHLVAVPFAAQDIQRIVGNAQDIFQVAFQLRIRSVSGEDSVGVFVGNYLTAGMIFLPLFVVGLSFRKIGGWLFAFISTPWIVLSLLIGGRGGLVAVILSSLYVYLAFGGRFRLKVVATFLVVFIFILVSGNLLVGKIDATLEDGVRDVAVQSVKGFFDYFFAGPILFSRYLENPGQFVPTWDALIFSCHILEKLGLCSVPNIHQEFLSFNVGGDIGNVYSVAFSVFPKYGYMGLLLVFFLYGLLAAYFHRNRYASLFKLLIASFLFYACVLSVYLDAFGPSSYFFVKVFILSLVIKFAFIKPLASGADAGRAAT